MIQEPVQPTASPSSPRPRGSRPSNGVIALVVIACLALAVPVVAVIAASSATAPSAVGAGDAPAAAVPVAGKANGNGQKGNNGNGNGNGNNGAKGLRLKGGQGKGPISITAIDGSNVSLKTLDGWTRTIAVASTTVITKGGQTITVSGLAVGDVIRFHQVRNADGTFTVDRINVPTPKAGGEVTAVGASSITVKKGGATRVITVTGSTVYTVGSAPGTKADVKVGSKIGAQGTVSGDTFTATAIKVEPPSVAGEVTAKTGTTITLRRGDGSTATIHVSGTTKYRVRGADTGALADIAVGDRVTAAGTLRADGSLDAVTVQKKGPKAAQQKNSEGGAAPSPAAS